MDLMKGYPVKLRTDTDFEASFATVKDAMSWFELGRYQFAALSAMTKSGDYVYYAELTSKNGTTEVWLAR